MNYLPKNQYRKFQLQEIDDPNLFRDIYPYSEVPKVIFDNKVVPRDIPDDFWITCTTFRDGQQARPPYSVRQIVDLYDLMHKFGGSKGIIRQCEFFLYTKKDRDAVEKCLERGYEFPKVTSWIRANKNDFQLVKSMGLKETGILTSVSDYHIFLKLNKSRKGAMDAYLGVVKEALDAGIRPRCHLEDLTRADIYGFVLPFVQALTKLSEESGIPIKMRLCDTLGYGVPYADATLPRSVPKLVYALVHEGGIPKDRLEWHGHNDFHKALINATTAWIYGCAAANGTLLGFGERTGNPPIEGLIIEYLALKGTSEGIETTVITEIAEYFRKEIRAVIPPNYPFVGASFNTTRAGIHADGVFKNEEIYNIFDTIRLLKRPIRITVTDKSGLAGIAYWVDSYLGLEEGQRIAKHNPGVVAIAKWVEDRYRNKCATGISDEEMLMQARRHLPQYFESDLDRIKKQVHNLVVSLIKELKEDDRIISMNPSLAEPFMEEIIQEEHSIQFIYIVDTDGKKVTKNITQIEDTEGFEKKGIDSDFSKRPWFVGPMQSGEIHVSNLYTSRITEKLCMTVSAPIKKKEGSIVGILGIDIKFEELAKL